MAFSDRRQKVDHGGKWLTIPEAMLSSPSYLSLSLRARSALTIIQSKFNGFNNGHIGLGRDELGRLLGNQNHRSNSRAMLELIEHGFIECMCDACFPANRAREWRITFISTTDQKTGRQIPATHEWKEWKSRGAKSSHQSGKSGEPSSQARKVRGEAATQVATESCASDSTFHGEDVSRHIYTRDRGTEDAFANPCELRRAVNVLVGRGEITARALADKVGMPEGTMSKFRDGRGLPEVYRHLLHTAIGSYDWRTVCATGQNKPMANAA